MGICALVGVGAALLWRQNVPTVVLATGTYLEPRRALPDFSLIDQRGQRFGLQNLKGHWSFLFFGYTNCPDVCPATLSTLAAMQKKLRSGASRPQVIFVSVDAKRDTPEQLARYVPYFDPEFIGVTAPDQPSIEALAAQLGIFVQIAPQPDGSYTVDHSGEILVVDPDGKLAAILTGPFAWSALASDFQRIAAGRA
jgi:protein SCO1